jgi:low molecular weight protein-tyrosine phosphatase
MALRILTVCTANVCRSPMAAALAQRHLEANGIDALVTSAGTHRGQVLVDPDAVRVMAERGLDITACTPRLLDRVVVTEDGADLVVAMTRVHLQAVAVMGAGVFKRSFTAKELARRTHRVMFAPGLDEPTFAAWRDAVGEGRLARDLLGEDPGDDIADPYGKSLAEHRRTADELDVLMAVIARSIAAWPTS